LFHHRIPSLHAFPTRRSSDLVHRNGRDPGVWFFSLDASSSIAVAAARAAYKLPYFHSHIDFSASSEAIPQIEFRSRRDDSRGAMPASAHARYAPADTPVTRAPVGSLEFFLVERYVLYTIDEEH